jgi:hypothetical protein
MNPKEVRCVGVDCIRLAQDRDHGWAVGNPAVNLRVP